jgi:hypothetical protein
VRDPDANCEELDLEQGSSKDFLPKAFGEAGVELSKISLHNKRGNQGGCGVCRKSWFLNIISAFSFGGLQLEDEDMRERRNEF